MRPMAAVLAAALTAALATPAGAQQRQLAVAALAAPGALDPHLHWGANSSQALRQIFDALTAEDTRGAVLPRLAAEWRAAPDGLTWEFRLRPGVRFHDGTPLEAEDVAFTLARVPTVPNSPGPFVRAVAAVEVVDPHTVRLRTREPSPLLDRDLAQVMILSRRVHAGAASADFTGGRLAVGTGAYRHIAYAPGERHEVARNPDFWGEPPPWGRVVTRYVPSPAARVAALLAGEVDLIDGVPVQDVARLRADPRIAVFGTDSASTVYLFPDADRDGPPPAIADHRGRPPERNPLKDRRVREALSLAINRQGIVDRLLSGEGRPADQFAAPAAPDRAAGLDPLPHDPGRARRLLAEAGYPDGFRLTIHGPGGAFAGDENVLQAVAQGFTRVGVETRVEALPPAVLLARAAGREFALFMATYTNSLAGVALRQVAMTRDDARGHGPFNRQRYSNPALDAPLAEALGAMDEGRRLALTAGAMRALVEDKGVIPVLHPRHNWAARRDRVRYEPSPLGHTTALLASPAD